MIRGNSIARRVGVASLCVTMTGLVAVIAPTPLVAGAAVQVISTTRVSLSNAGAQLSTPAGTQNLATPGISDDGRWVGFATSYSDAVPGDTNNTYDTFVRDTVNGTTTRVSVATDGTQATAFSFIARLSADGRHVVFRSNAANLVPGDVNGSSDIFVRDRDTDADGIFDEPNAVRTQIMSRAASPGTIAVMASGNGISGGQGDPPTDISASGRFVAFDSNATDLIGGDSNLLRDVFVRDRDTDADGIFDEPGAESTIRMNVSGAGAEAAGGDSSEPRLSRDGRFIAFASGASNLDPVDTNGRWDVFVHDRDTDADGIFDEVGAMSTKLMSTTAAGLLGNDDVIQYGAVDLSPNGRYVAFLTEASNLTPGDGANSANAFRRDRDADGNGIFDEPGGVTVQLLDERLGFGSGSMTSWVGVADDGTATFTSGSTDLVTGDTNGFADTFVRAVGGPVTNVSVATDGTQGTTNDNNHNQTSFTGTEIAGSGRRIVYVAGFENLVTGDTNNSTDVFLTEISDRPTSVTAALSANTVTTGPGATSVPINAIPTERIKSLGLDVASSPTGAKYRPTAPKYRPTGAKYRPTGAKYRPTGAKFRPTGAKYRPVAETTLDTFSDVLATIPTARTTPLSQLPIDLDAHTGGWPALLVGTPLQGTPTQSISIGQVMDLLVGITLAPAHPLRSVLVGEIETDESPLDGVSPAAFMLGKTPLNSLAFSPTQTWCDRLSIETSAATTCAGLAVGGTTTMLDLDLNPTASVVLDEYPVLRRIPLAQNRTVLNTNAAPIMSARLEDLGLSVTRLGDVSLPETVAAVPAVAAIALDPLPVPIRDAVAVCTTASFDCTGKTLGQAATAGALTPTAKLADLGPHYGSVAVGSLTATLLTGIDINDVITGYLERSDFPWEDLDLVTAGVQEFASSGSTVDYSLAIQANGGSASYDATAVVTLPVGFRLKPGTDAISGGPGVSIDSPTTSYTAKGTTITWVAHGVLPDTSYQLVFTALPGFKLGTFGAGAKVTIVDVLGASAGVPITVNQNTDPGDTAGTAQPISGDTLYFQYIADGADVDVYDFSPSAGAQVGVRLSHLAGDGDLVLYGPPTDAAGTGPSAKASRAIPIAGQPLDDGGSGRNPKASTSGNDLGADVPHLDGQTVVGHSASSGITDMEETSAAGANLVQVSAYQGSTSTEPYLLRVREFIPEALPACPAYSRTGGTAGVLPNLAALPANLDTLVLVNQQRLGDTFGAAAGPLMTKLGQLASASGVVGAVVPVEGSNSSLAGYPDVAAAYSAWNADPCVPSLANDVVDQIGALVDGIRAGTLPGVAAHPQLKNIVLVGADDIVPMARLADTTRAGNEMQYAESFDVTSEYYSALASSHFLSDDPYGDIDPVGWMDRRLYVPDFAIGRLVETPAEITTMIDQYLASNGHLDTSRAFVSGYDFMIPGANKLSSILSAKLTQAGGAAPTVATRISNSWTAGQVLGDFTANPPSVAALSSHADHTGAVSAAGFVSGSVDDLSAADLAATLPIGSRLLFSLGCHAGLNASDAVTLGGPAAPDWAQQMSARGAVYIGQSGFSLGDDSGSQLHDLLMQHYARQLDGAVTVGDALMLAKQKYFSTKGLYGAYDDKVISSTIMYGIPMFQVGNGTTVRPPATNRTTTAGPGTLQQSAFSVNSSFTPRTSADGGWFEVGDDAPLAIPGRPVQPRTDLDVTAAGSPGQLNPAHGAIVTALTTGATHTNFDAAWSRATVDLAANEPELVSAEVGFPERLVAVTSATDPEGLTFGAGPRLRQTLVVVPGRFETDAVDDAQGIGTQQLFDTLAGTAYYSTSADYIEPRLSRVTATVTATTASFSVQATDASGIVRAVVLHEDSAGWHTTDLTASGATWSGTAAVPGGTTDVPYFVQVVDGAGNVGVSTNKGAMFDATVRPSISVSDVSLVEPVSGTSTATFTVSLSTAPVLPVTVDYTTLDGSAHTPADYLATSGTLSFAAGETSKTVGVTVAADGISEPTEQYTLELSAPTNATILDGSGRGRILSGLDTEPDAPVAPIATLGPLAGQATVSWAPPGDDGGSAITGYRVLRGTTSGTLTEIGTTDDVTTTLVDTSAGAGTSRYYYAVVAQNAVGESPSSAETSFAPVTVSVSDASVFEPDVATPGVTGRLRITLSQPAPTDTKVTYYTVSGSATGAVTGGDFKTKGTVVKPLTATIKAGKVFAAATVLIRTDAAVESDETLQVHLANVTLGTPVIGDADGEITIRDSDSIAEPDPVLVVTDARILEGGFGGPRTVQLLAQLDRPLASDLQLQWQTADGTATQPADYKRKTLTKPFIRAGKLFAVLTVTLYPDVLIEGDHTLTVPVSVFAGGPVTVVDGTGTITLADDD